MKYDKVLLDSIERERNGSDYCCPERDKAVLETMLDQINDACGTDIHFLAEIGALNIPGAGTIMAQYLDWFQSESVRGYLIPQIVSDRVPDCAGIVLSAYLHLKNSDAFLPLDSQNTPCSANSRFGTSHGVRLGRSDFSSDSGGIKPILS